MISPLHIVIISLVMLTGVLLGRSVQNKIHFAYPCDPVTVMIFSSAIIVSVIDYIIGMRVTFWLVPFVLGYIAGYLFNGFHGYLYVTTATSLNHIVHKPWVIYYDNGMLCRQEQSWSALWDRWRWGIHHQVISNDPIESTVSIEAHSFLYPTITGRSVLAEAVLENKENVVVKQSKKLKTIVSDGETITVPKKTVVKTVSTTTLIAATGQQVPKAELMIHADALDIANSRIAELERELYFERQNKRTIVPEIMGSILKDNLDRRVENLILTDKEKKSGKGCL